MTMTLINANVNAVLPMLPKARCIFMDPPDNIATQYSGDSTHDYRDDYVDWVSDLFYQSQRHADIVWCSYNQIWMIPLLDNIVRSEDWNYRHIIWTYTFGQYNDKDFARNFRPILLGRRNGVEFSPGSIRVESERMKSGDKRAAGPRVPGDVWEFPRVVGNAKERQPWHPTQHPVALYDRVMKYSCGNGDTFVDLFAGSGTCFRAGLLNPHVHVVGIEQSFDYCTKMNDAFPEMKRAS